MYETLTNSKLFKGLGKSEIIHIFNLIHHQVKTYQAEEIIAYSGCKCDKLFMLIEGSVRGEMIDDNGKIIKVEDVFAPDTFAEAFLFAETPELLVNIIANNNVTILIFQKDDFFKLLNTNNLILNNYLTVLSNRFVTVTDRMKTLSLKKLEGKLANYFLQLEKTNKSSTFKLAHTHQQLADYFGVARPSLSRAISLMVKEGILNINKKEVEILDKNKLYQMFL
ncbi:MAG: Crp/Fnr family transcriptional regulator [Bacteroidales bacterium]|nr:Crp/Fnr family transcriptional regulator [Bacteroidales bacterium]